MTEYKEIIVALIAVFGAVLPYLLQKNKELNLKIAEQKREAYTSFLKNFTEVALAVMHDEELSGKDADRDRMLARDQLTRATMLSRHMMHGLDMRTSKSTMSTRKVS
jgi:hypothetical protein